MAGAAQTIGHVLREAVAHHGQRIALVDARGAITYAQLWQRALRAAAVFRGIGVVHGDRVAIWLPNSVQWVEAALGIALIGATIVPVSTRLKGNEAAYILSKSGARVLLAPTAFLGQDYLAMLQGEPLPALEARLRTDFGGSGAWEQALAAVTTEAAEAVAGDLDRVGPADIAEIIFTSGTTGFPKGVMLRHEQVVSVYSVWADGIGLVAGDRYLISAPMFHSFGFKAGVFVSILKGATMYPVQTFDAAETLDTIEREKITVTGGPPTIFTSLLQMNKAAGRDISSLRSVATGASMVSPDLIRALQRDVGVEIVVNAYGLTEASALCTMTAASDPVEVIALTAGKPIKGIELRCVGKDGAVAATGEEGEIQVRGHNVMAGYFDEPQETAAMFTADGWMMTGDIGVVDAAGNLSVTDRLKDMFIVGGFNCYPAEIEKIMLTHPQVREVGVIGVPDDRLGEVGKAFVVTAPGAAFDTQAFIAWCREHMANFKVPRFVEVVDALPRNAMGKMQKFILRARR
ncbi:MAG: AMP-binding protein [Rhizobiaceae bacterium]|nr:AMP-binding protein [Rhizobiaceae bacterium]